MPHDFSVDAARAAAENDELEAWVARFLASPGSDNAVLADKLSSPPRWWCGPVEMRLDQLHRLAGPPGSPALVTVDDDYWRDDVAEMAELIAEDWEPPPVIVSYRDGQYVLEDGTHRVESLRRADETTAWAVVAFDTEVERDRFVAEHLRVESS